MRAVPLLLSFALVAQVGCFPDSARHRTYAKIGEGTALLAGITMLAVTHTGADCMTVAGTHDLECHDRANIYGDIGLGLILAGLAGFIATVSSTPDEKPEPPPPLPVPPPASATLPAPASPTTTTTPAPVTTATPNP